MSMPEILITILMGLALPLAIVAWMHFAMKRHMRRYDAAKERYDREASRLQFEASMRGECYVPQPFMFVE